MRSILSGVVAVSVLVVVCGCAPTYYRVTDPTTGRAYYTTELKEKGAGSVQLKDAGTGSTVTLQNSEIRTVNKEEFESGKVRSTIDSSEGASGAGAAVRPDAPIGAAAVEGFTWRLVEVDGQPAEPIRSDERPASFRLDPVSKRVSGYGGVNQLSGPYEVNGKTLKFGELAMTRRAGSEPLMRQESELSRAMEQTASWRSAGRDEIEFLDAGGKRLARFQRAAD